MKFLRSAALAAIAALTVSACSESTTAPPDGEAGNVRFDAAIKTASVPFGKAAIAEAVAHGSTVDSLRITSVKMMIHEIKLHRVDGGEEKVKVGPALLVVDQSGVKASIYGDVPAGTYNKVNVKFHRLNDQEIGAVAGNADYADFTGAARPTIVIEGTSYAHGETRAFRYLSRVEEDLKFDLADFAIDTSGVTVIILELDPVAVFKDKDTREVLDPSHDDNANRIDSAIKDALNSLRK